MHVYMNIHIYKYIYLHVLYGPKVHVYYINVFIYLGWLGDGTPPRPLRVDRSPYDPFTSTKNIINASKWKVCY
jgi:hypothetical protein